MACKPGSVPYDIRSLSFIYAPCHQKALAIYPPTGASSSLNVGLHDLTAPKMHSSLCRHTTGKLLPHLLTLTLAGGYFLLHYSTLADSFLLGSGMLYAARTFLLRQCRRRQTGLLLFLLQRYEK